MNKILKLDREFLIFLNNQGSELYDVLWLNITNQFTWIPLFALILYLIFKEFGLKKSIFTFLFIVTFIVFSDQFTNTIRGIFERLRPNNDPSISHLLRPNLINPQSFSFISGHATTSSFFTVFIILLLKHSYKWIKLLVLFPLIFAYSRIYLGVHFPSDIIIGGCVGVILGFLFFQIYQKITLKWNL